MPSDLIDWLSRLAHGHALPEGWVITGLVVLLAVLILGLVVLAPRSRRWARANRLHRLASRNEAVLRQGARRQLDDALRALTAARRACVASHREEDAGQIDHLARQIEVVRDRVACDYTPSPANMRGRRRELNLDTLYASELVGSRCAALAQRVSDGSRLLPADVSETERTAQEIERGLALL